jgi:hypothetical protein
MTATTSTTSSPVPSAPPSLGIAALRALRATRTRRRLGDVEWFEAAYRVYLVALVGGGLALWASELVGDTPLTNAQADEVAARGPAVLGAVLVLALVLGLRSGSQGGPLALEPADVVHVMTAPIPVRVALLRPAVQRVRSAAFAGAAVGAVGGQLAGRRLPGTALAWCGSGLLFGLTVGVTWAAAALVAHGARLALRWSTAVGLTLVVWQAAAITGDLPGPADRAGSLAMWGWRQHVGDVVAPLVAIALTGAGIALLHRTSLEALVRRSGLVAQLRFAVTMQDLRTVVLLRRQLAHERTRQQPWFARFRRDRPWRPSRLGIVWRRDWQGLLRTPSGRLLRMVTFAIGAGLCQAAVVHGTTPAVIGTTVLLFLLGLELLEPLSQEVDQPDLTDAIPSERGAVMARHLRAPLVAAVPFAALAGSAAVVADALVTDAERLVPAIVIGAILALPVTIVGVLGGAVSIVRDAPDPLADTTNQIYFPPEMAGVTTMVRTVLPLVVGGVGSVATLPVVDAIEDGASSAVAMAVRAAIGLVLVAWLVVTWVRLRDRVRASIRAFLRDGRAATAEQRSSRSTS